MKPILKVVLITCLHVYSLNSNGQNKTVEPLPGYKRILDRRFNSDQDWMRNQEQNVAALIDAVLKLKKSYNLVVPLQYVETGKDTLVLFYYSKDLISIHRKQRIAFTSHNKIEKPPFATLSKRANEQVLDYDSIYQVMTENMLVNSEKFNLDTYLDSKTLNATCCLPKNQEDRLYLIYQFFRNGILLGEDTYTGRLYYKPY